MRFLQKFGFRLQWVFLVLCLMCGFASTRINENWIVIATMIFASISIFGWCIESSASSVLKETEKESKIIREMLNKCFEKKDDGK